MKLKKYVMTGLAIGLLGAGGVLTSNAASNTTINHNQTDKKENREADFSKYVTSGLLTQETADKLKAAVNEKKASEKSTIDAMTETERKAYFDSKKESFFQEFVPSILTQDQADTLKTDFTSKKMKGNFDFNQFVTSNIIDQTTADKAKAYMDSKKAEFEAERAKVEAMTKEEKDAFFASKKAKNDLFQELVDNNILTTDQANKIKEQMPQKQNKMKTRG